MPNCTWFLTGEDMAKLSEKARAVGLDRGRLHGDQERVSLWTGKRFFPQGEPLTIDRRKIVVNDEPIVVTRVVLENEFATAPHWDAAGEAAEKTMGLFTAGRFEEQFNPDISRFRDV